MWIFQIVGIFFRVAVTSKYTRVTTQNVTIIIPRCGICETILKKKTRISYIGTFISALAATSPVCILVFILQMRFTWLVAIP